MSSLLLGRRIALHPLASMDARFASPFLHRMLSPQTQRTQDLLEKINPPAAQRPIIEKQLLFFPPARGKHAHRFDEDIMESYKELLKSNPSDELLGETAKLLPIFPRKWRTWLLDTIEMMLKTKHENVAQVLAQARAILHFLPARAAFQAQSTSNTVPKFRPRTEFLAHGVYVALRDARKQSRTDMVSILSKVHAHKAAGSKFFPADSLLPFSCEFCKSCSYTKPTFIKAFISGTLVQTTAPIDGVQKTVYVKGFWSNSGNTLAYDPQTNCVYAIRMENGKILETDSRYDYNTHKEHKGTELQDLFKNAQP